MLRKEKGTNRNSCLSDHQLSRADNGELLPPVVGRFVLDDRFAGFDEFLTVGVVRPSREGTASDHSDDEAVHNLAQSCAVTGHNVPLNCQAIQTDHTVQFRSHQEDERPDHTVVVRVNGREVRTDCMRIEEHRNNVREDHERQDDSRDELDDPERRVAVSDEFVLALHVVEHAIARREATESHQSVDDHEERDEANEDNVHPSVFFTVENVTAGESDQVPEDILTQLDGARESHVAEQEQAQEQTRNGLSNVAVCVPLALTLSVCQFNTSDNFAARRGVGVLFLIG